MDSQGTDIQNLESMAIESLDRASSGVSHIMSTMQVARNKNKHLYAVAIGIVMFVLVAHWMFWSRGGFENGNDTNNDMAEHP